jgi:hypothetical protein
MDEPVRSRHRPASRRGLTSPPGHRTPRPNAPGNPPASTPGKAPDKPHDSERQENHAHNRPKINSPGPADEKP